ARVLVKTPITPNMLTLFGLLLNGVVAVLLATDHLVAGGVMIIVAGLFDMLDGALAKITNRMSTFGAFLDSVVDRYSEAIILLGLLLYYYLHQSLQATPNIGSSSNPLEFVGAIVGSVPTVVLIYTVLVGSMMISYTRAR